MLIFIRYSLLFVTNPRFETTEVPLCKIANAASEIAIIELLKIKYLPILYHGLGACHINKSIKKSAMCFKTVQTLKLVNIW